MTTLYSYRVPQDRGSAPNPFWRVCTLVLCKPSIRRAAQVGDWVVGTGSKRSPLGDTSQRVIYAMRVTRKITMEEYDAFAATECPGKVVDGTSSDPRRWVGDAIYDFSKSPARVRPGAVHGVDARDHDLGGRFALLSTDFYYFGRDAPPLPTDLVAVAPNGRGHQSRLNDRYLERFVAWIRSERRGRHGDPQCWEGGATACRPRRAGRATRRRGASPC